MVYLFLMADVDLEKLFEPHQEELKTLGEHLAAGQRDKFIAGAATLVGAVATGNPSVALLAPFAEKVVARAFASAADERLRVEIEAMEREDERRAFVKQIGDAIQVLVDQAVLQMVRVQHNIAGELEEKVAGRMHEELDDFRSTFADNLNGYTVRLEEQVVREGAIGVRVSPNAAKRVFIRRMDVAGKGSVGIDLG